MAQTVFITGASKGIGLEFVKQILAWKTPPKFLFAGCLDTTKADELLGLAQKNDLLKVIAMDITKDAEIESAFQQTKSMLGGEGLNLLVNNAGVYDKSDDGYLEMQTREKMQLHFNVNITSPMLVCQKFLPLVKQASALRPGDAMSTDKAAIINISSGFGSMHRSKQNNGHHAYHYRASKAALNMVTALMSMEFKPAGVLVAAINPGWVWTDMGSPNATLSVEESVKSCLATIGGMTESSSGLLFDYGGDVIPW